MHRINAPAFTGAAVVAGHAPAQCDCGNARHVDDGYGKALRIATPCLTACDRTATVIGDRAVVATHQKASSGGKNVLERISTVGAELEHATVETHIRIDVGGFKIEIVPECQLTATAEKLNRHRIEPFIA